MKVLEMLGMLVCACKPGPQKIEAGGLLGVQSQPRLNKTVSKSKPSGRAWGVVWVTEGCGFFPCHFSFFVFLFTFFLKLKHLFILFF